MTKANAGYVKIIYYIIQLTNISYVNVKSVKEKNANLLKNKRKLVRQVNVANVLNVKVILEKMKW